MGMDGADETVDDGDSSPRRRKKHGFSILWWYKYHMTSVCWDAIKLHPRR